MSPVGPANPLIIETRRTARGKAELLKNDKFINNLNTGLGANDRGDDSSRDARRPKSLYRSGAERDVPFRHSVRTPRLNTAFVAQLLGQAMPERAPQSSDALAAYNQSPALALVYDRCL
jgi:hypothetical protein